MAKNKLQKPHKQKKFILKTTRVDVGIIPVVSWLNSIEGIFTFASCQGGYHKSCPPWIEFMYAFDHALDQVIVVFRGQYGELLLIDPRMFYMRFHNKTALKDFINDRILE